MLVTVVVAVPLGALIGFSRWADAAFGLLFDFLRLTTGTLRRPIVPTKVGSN